jgi:hypothetical protein
MQDPIPFNDVLVKKMFRKTWMALLQERLLGSIPILDTSVGSVLDMAVDITTSIFTELGYDNEKVRFYCLAQQRAASKITGQISHGISLANDEAWHPLPGAPLRFRLKFVFTLQLRLGTGSGLLSAGLFAFNFYG